MKTADNKTARIFLSLFLPFLLYTVPSLSSCGRQDDTETLLEDLDAALGMRRTYDKYFQERVSLMKQILDGQDDPGQKYTVYMKLADEYRSYSLDSTLTCLLLCKEIAMEMDDSRRIVESDLALAYEYAMTGYHTEASDLLDQYREWTVPQGLEYEYFQVCHALSGEMMAYTNTVESYRDKIAARDRYRQLLLSMTPEKSYEWYRLKLEEYEEKDVRDSMLVCATEMVRLSEENSRQYASATWFYQYSLDYDDPDRIEWLVRSAIADVMNATRDYASLTTLAQILFDRGDIDRAFRYLADYSLRDAIAFNGKLRPWQVARIFPEIERAYQQKSERQQRMMMVMVITMSALAAVLVLLLLFIFKRQQLLDETRLKLSRSYVKIEDQNRDLINVNKEIMALNESLREADKVKQEYIAQFLSILSENINTTRQYKNHVLRYIRRGAAADLVSEIEALPPIDEDIEEFYKMFDRTFVNLYPDFVDKFNGLLQDGAGIYPKADDILTPELRIFALIKMGITDSSKIALLLHYSANTIYNYRAKVRNKARDSKEEFDKAVKSL